MRRFKVVILIIFLFSFCLVVVKSSIREFIIFVEIFLLVIYLVFNYYLVFILFRK